MRRALPIIFWVLVAIGCAALTHLAWVLITTPTPTIGGGGVTATAQAQTCAQAQVWMEGAAAPQTIDLSLRVFEGQLLEVNDLPVQGTATLRIPSVGFQGRQQPADILQGRNFGSGSLETSQVRLVSWISFPEGDPVQIGEILGCVGGPRLAGVPSIR